jgi:hypothetical protein
MDHLHVSLMIIGSLSDGDNETCGPIMDVEPDGY